MTDDDAARIISLLEQIRDRLPVPWHASASAPLPVRPLSPWPWDGITLSNLEQQQVAQ